MAKSPSAGAVVAAPVGRLARVPQLGAHVVAAGDGAAAQPQREVGRRHASEQQLEVVDIVLAGMWSWPAVQGAVAVVSALEALLERGAVRRRRRPLKLGDVPRDEAPRAPEVLREIDVERAVAPLGQVAA